MTTTAAPVMPGGDQAGVTPETLAVTRTNVRELLSASPAFRALPADTQREIARNTVEVATYLAEPEGMRIGAPGLPGLAATDPYAMPLAEGQRRVQETGGGDGFVAQGASEGARVAGALLQAVNFPTFVASLVQGVFHAIVQTSIEQMEAYGKLVADVAKTMNQFRDENVSVNQGRDHLVDQFPDVFTLDMDTGANGGEPRVRVREGVDDRAALARVNSLPVDTPITSLDDDMVEEKLVPAARTQLATSRQQLLATMVLMGINRIVVTDGRISAKVLYDFQAKDNYKKQLSATQFDYGDQYSYTGEGSSESETIGGERSRTHDEAGRINTEDRDGSYYSKGTYKYNNQPVLTLASATNETTDAALTTKASLAGMVDINFKSDYFPLEKMADSFQIAQIQQAAGPGGKPGAAPASAAPAAQAPASGAAPAAGAAPAPAQQAPRP